MRPFFQPRLVNDPFGDPGLRVDLVGLGQSLLFDLGWVDPPGPGRLAPVSRIFVSHTHVDHFMGFDALLRSQLPLDKKLRFYGPEGFVANVEGKLRGYTWNLVAEYALELEVWEVGGSLMRSVSYRCRNGLAREEGPDRPFGGALCSGEGYSVEAARLDHRVPCLAFLLREPFHLGVNKEKLKAMGLAPGPWLRALKRLIHEGAEEDAPVQVPPAAVLTGEPRTLRLRELQEETVIVTRGQRIAYVVDCLYSEENRARIVSLARGADVLYCEAAFLHADEERARASGHLTARQAGLLAREAGARALRVFHFSKRHQGRGVELLREAMDAFGGLAGAGCGPVE